MRNQISQLMLLSKISKISQKSPKNAFKPKYFIYSNFNSYIKKYLGSPTDIDVEKLKTEKEKLASENVKLKNKINEL